LAFEGWEFGWQQGLLKVQKGPEILQTIGIIKGVKRAGSPAVNKPQVSESAYVLV